MICDDTSTADWDTLLPHRLENLEAKVTQQHISRRHQPQDPPAWRKIKPPPTANLPRWKAERCLVLHILRASISLLGAIVVGSSYLLTPYHPGKPGISRGMSYRSTTGELVIPLKQIHHPLQFLLMAQVSDVLLDWPWLCYFLVHTQKSYINAILSKRVRLFLHWIDCTNTQPANHPQPMSS